MTPIIEHRRLERAVSRSRDASIPAVREVSLAVAARECVGIVGESGSGKTQIFMAAMGLLARQCRGPRQRAFRGRGDLGSAGAAS